MNILTFTSLWPNAEQPNFAVFVKHRVAAMAKLAGVNVRAIAPIPYVPKAVIRSLPPTVLNRLPVHWRQMARLPEQELIAGIETFHPRYLVTPKVGMSFYGGWMARGTWQVTQRLHCEKPIDVIDAHYVYPDGYAATLLGKRLNVPVFITARGTDINLFSQMLLIRPKIVSALHRATGIIAVSDALKQRMVELGISAEKIAVIRNGIDREVFHPRNRDQARRKLNLDPEDRIILTVSSLVPLKGIDRLIEAMVLLNKTVQGSRFKLFVIGEGSERAKLQAQISALKLQNHVLLVGAKPQAELADWYSAADLFCLASHREGCPNVVIEAAACGVPVVAVDVGGVRELVTAQRGRVFSPSSPEHLASEIESALAFPWDRRLIADLGSSRCWQAVACETRDWFGARKKI